METHILETIEKLTMDGVEYPEDTAIAHMGNSSEWFIIMSQICLYYKGFYDEFYQVKEKRIYDGNIPLQLSTCTIFFNDALSTA